MKALTTRWRWWLLAASGAVMALMLLAGDEAWARVGGGHSYSSGGGSSSSSSGSSSSGGEAAIARLLIWLCLEHPIIGIPVTVVVVGGFLYIKMKDNSRGSSKKQPQRTHSGGNRVERPHPVQQQRRRRSETSLDALTERDPNFSEPLFLDLVHLIFIRAHEARSTGAFGPLAPFLSEQAAASLKTGGETVSEVVVGACAVTSLRITGDVARFVVSYEANYTESLKGSPARLFTKEQWTFQRAASAHSPGPDRMQALRCPSCGNAVETRPDGTCVYCDSVITDGQLQWQAVAISVTDRRAVRPPHLQLGGGPEPGLERPTLQAPDLQANLRAIRARHPDFEMSQFRETAAQAFMAMQEAWSELDWERARPYQTDRLYQSNRFWIEAYKRSGYQNHLADIKIDRMQPARITLDAWYESITVRIYARMKDWTTDDRGKVIGGSDKQAKIFSEYWTFVRSATQSKESWDGKGCPSCGAALDRLSETGVCGYCDSKITTGQFTWVLSAITQDESYTG